MSTGKGESLGAVVDLNEANARWLYPDLHNGQTPLAQPGIVVLTSGKHEEVVSRRADAYRPFDQGNPDTFESDLLPVSGAVLEVLSNPYRRAVTFNGVRPHGTEAELNAVDVSTGEAGDLWSDGRHVGEVGEAVAYAPELWRNTWEVSGSAMPTAQSAYDVLFSRIQAVQERLNEHGMSIDPSSARMQDVPARNDTTPHKYVQAMVDTLGNRIMNFVGTGIHEHFDVDLQLGPQVSTRIRMITPFLNASLNAAPFMHGQQIPDLGEILDIEALTKYRGVQPHSVRYPTRAFSSKNGGVGQRVAPQDLNEYLRHADRLVSSGEIKSPERAFGQHADRLRVDPPSPKQPDHLGRIEVCAKDTAGLNIDVLVANSELTRAVLTQIEAAVAEGESGIAALHQKYPELFGADPEAGATQLEYAHHNSVEVAYHGVEATVVNGLGRRTTARKQIEALIEFSGVQEKTAEVIGRSLIEAHQLENVMYSFRDEDGLPSMEGYYCTGYGSAAQWMIARAQAEAERHAFPEAPANQKVIMKSGTSDRVASFGRYLSGLTL